MSTLPHDDWAAVRRAIGLARRFWWLLLLGPVVAGGATALYLYLQPPAYRATAVVRLADARRSLARGVETPGEEPERTPEQLLSQVHLLRSRWLAGLVLDSVGLRLQPAGHDLPSELVTDVLVPAEAPPDTLRLEFRDAIVIARGLQDTATAAYGQPLEVGAVRFTVLRRPRATHATWVVLMRERGVDEFLKHLRVARRPGTTIVDVSFIADRPEVAHFVVNRLAVTYESLDAQAAQEQSRRRRVFLEGQLHRTDSLLARAQLTLSAFRSRNQVYSSQERATAQQAALLDLGARVMAAEADRDRYRALIARLADADPDARAAGLEALSTMPEVIGTPLVARLYDQLLTQRHTLDSLQGGEWAAAATHPDVIRLQGLVRSTEDRLVATLRGHLTSIETQLGALAQQYSRAAGQARGLPAVEAEDVRLIQQVDGMRRLSDQLREEHQRASMAEAIAVGALEIVDFADLPYQPVPRFAALKLLLALIFGLAVAAGGALAWERLDASFRRTDEMEGTLQIHSLAIVPQVLPRRTSGARALRSGNGDGGPRAEVVTLARRPAPLAEAYRLLRTKLSFSPEARGLRTLLVTSTVPGEGKTITVANLAGAFAGEGRRVLLVDADLWHGRLHGVFEVPAEPGLTECLQDRCAPEAAIHVTAIPTLSILPRGRTPSSPADLIGGARMQRLLRQLAERYDLVLLDSPPVLATADAALLGTLTDGVLLVVRAGRTDREAVQHAVRHLTAVGARLVGAVLNDPSDIARRSGYYSGYYGSAVYAGKEGS